MSERKETEQATQATKSRPSTNYVGQKLVPPVIARAIIAIQLELKPLAKTKTNTEYGSSYVPLEEVAARAYEMLSKHGIGVMQPPTSNESGAGMLETILVHKSGVSFSRTTRLVLGRNDPQAHGTSITYMRRYALMGMLGLTAENDDDDGNGALENAKPTKEQLDELVTILRHLKYQSEDIEREVARARTRATAVVMIRNYRKMIKDYADKVEAADEGIEPTPAPRAAATPQDALMDRLRALKLTSPAYENKVILQATRKPFISKVKSEDDLEKLDAVITALEDGTYSLPAEFYAPRPKGQAITVNEDVA